MKPFRDRLVIPAAAMLLLGFSSIGAAQPALSGARASEPVEAVPAPAPDFGTSTQSILHVSITSFRSAGSTYSLTTANTGAIYFYQDAPATQDDWWAQLSLPSGAIVDSVSLDAYDSSATGQIQFGLARADAGAATGSNVTPVGTTGTAAVPGYGFFTVTPFSTLVIDNNLSNYWLFVDWSTNSSALKVAGFRIYYHLQVSPAPAVASFTDVPTSYWAFQYIEALKASGITQGVTPTTFEPESNVTRAQMAVFLAKALGLHFPN